MKRSALIPTLLALGTSMAIIGASRESMGPAIKTGKGQIPCKKHRSKQERAARKRIRKARRKNRTA